MFTYIWWICYGKCRKIFYTWTLHSHENSRESAAGTSISGHRQWNQHFWLLFALLFLTFSWLCCSFNVRKNNIWRNWTLSGFPDYIFYMYRSLKEHMNTHWQIYYSTTLGDYAVPETNSSPLKIRGLKMTFPFWVPFRVIFNGFRLQVSGSVTSPKW